MSNTIIFGMLRNHNTHSSDITDMRAALAPPLSEGAKVRRTRVGSRFSWTVVIEVIPYHGIQHEAVEQSSCPRGNRKYDF